MNRLVFCLLLASGVAWGQDVSDAQDPQGLLRFPYSWIYKYSMDDNVLPREFIVSAVEKTRRDIRIERKLSVKASIEKATYRIPEGISRSDVVAHYLELLGQGELFSCEGRDCGRSNQWANDVFKVAFLYGPDVNQYYLAANYGGRLVSVYIIERGNKRIYAHLEVMKPDSEVTVGLNGKLTESLAGNGFVVIEGVIPRADGTLPEESETVLADVSEQLNIFGGQQIYVVCHLYGPASAEQLLEAASHCSESANRQLVTPDGPDLVNFSAGPLLPRAAGAVPRIELVMPHRLNRD